MFFLLFLVLFMLLIWHTTCYAISEADPQDLLFEDEICVCKRRTETYLQKIGTTTSPLTSSEGDHLSFWTRMRYKRLHRQLQAGSAYLSFGAHIQYKGKQPLQIVNMYVSINGVKTMNWLPFDMEYGYDARFYVYSFYMDKFTEPGTYQVEWYINDINVHTGYLTIDSLLL